MKKKLVIQIVHEEYGCNGCMFKDKSDNFCIKIQEKSKRELGYDCADNEGYIYVPKRKKATK